MLKKKFCFIWSGILRRIEGFLVLLVLCFGSIFGLCAESLPQPAGMPAPVQITLGQSIVQLDGPWKFQVGDSPDSPGVESPLWSRPEFDDSKWETISLSPVAGSTSPFDSVSGWVPGWENKGHFGYWGYAWYRIHIHVDAAPSTQLALEGPAHVDDSYQVFANGALAGSFGDFSDKGRHPTAYNEQPQLFLLPGMIRDARAMDPATQVLALRVWMTPASLGKLSGGLHNAPLLGEAAAVESHYLLSRFERVEKDWLVSATALLFCLFLALFAGSMAFLDRTDPVYRWVMAVSVTMAFSTIEGALGNWTQLQSLAMFEFIMSVFFAPLCLFGWIMVWWFWFRLHHPAWIPRLIAGLTLTYMMSELGKSRFETVIPHGVIAASYTTSFSIRLCSLLLLLYIVVRGVKAQGLEGWLALPAALLTVAATFSDDLGSSDTLYRLGIRPFWHLFGLRVDLSQVANMITALFMCVLLLRRLLLSVRRQREMALDVMQAQEVQHVLLPESIHVPGLRIETEYRPAREVGGDFFQVLPQQEDGSVLIVAGT